MKTTMPDATAKPGSASLAPELRELQATLEKAIANRRPALINVVIDPRARRRPQQFAWLTR